MTCPFKQSGDYWWIVPLKGRCLLGILSLQKYVTYLEIIDEQSLLSIIVKQPIIAEQSL